MSEKQNVEASGLNRAKPYQLVLFPLNNGATNVYYVLVLSYIATFGSNVLALGGRVVGPGLAIKIVDTFLNTEFSGEERHQRRINQIED